METCDICLEGTRGLQLAPYSSWMEECDSCREHREYSRSIGMVSLHEKVDHIKAVVSDEAKKHAD